MSASVFPVPLSGIQETLIAAKGDLIVGTADNVAGILTAGTTNQVLTVDSTTTSGLKWATASGGFTFTTWTPTYTNLTIGNGTVVARYGTNGKFTIAQWQLTLGSTSSITGAPPTITLPTTPKTGNLYATTMLVDVGTDNYFGLSGIYSDAKVNLSTLYVTGAKVTNNSVSSTVPFTWTTNDYMGFVVCYEEA